MKALKLEQIRKIKANEYKLFKYVFEGIMFLFLLFIAINAKAQQPGIKLFNNINAEGIIIDGHDPVAFFTDNKPVKGDAAFRYGL